MPAHALGSISFLSCELSYLLLSMLITLHQDIHVFVAGRFSSHLGSTLQNQKSTVYNLYLFKFKKPVIWERLYIYEDWAI